jgi:hypothetical protein
MVARCDLSHLELRGLMIALDRHVTTLSLPTLTPEHNLYDSVGSCD